MLVNFPIITVILMCPQQFIGYVYWGSVLLPVTSQRKKNMGAQYAIN